VLWGLGLIIASPFVVYYARTHGPEVQGKLLRRAFIVAILFLFWLDWGCDLLAIGVVDYGWWWQPYEAAAILLSAGLLAVAPYRPKDFLPLSLALAALWAWAALLPGIPWDPDKCFAQHLRQVEGQPVTEVHRILGDYDVERDGTDYYGKMRELDLATLGPNEDFCISGYLGGAWIYVRDGVVSDIAVCFD